MKNVKLSVNDRKYIKKNLLPGAIRGSVIYGVITLSLSIIDIKFVIDLLTDIRSYTGFRIILTLASVALLAYVIALFGKYAVEFGRRIGSLLSDDYSVTDSVVAEMSTQEGSIFAAGPMAKASKLVFRLGNGDTVKLPQGSFRTPVVSSGQHAWLINYGVNHSYSVDYVFTPEAEAELNA